MQTIYTQIAGGRREYWTYCDGARIFISEKTARKLIAQGEQLIEVT